MKKEREIEMVLSNLKVCSDAKAKQAAFERMMNRHAELLAADSKDGVIRDKENNKRVKRLFGGELFCEELAMVAAGTVNAEAEKCPVCQRYEVTHIKFGIKECGFCGWNESESKQQENKQ